MGSGGAAEVRGTLSGDVVRPRPVASSVSTDVDGWTTRAKLSELVSPPQRAWNTKKLGWMICSDATAALTAGALVAPIITMIDR